MLRSARNKRPVWDQVVVITGASSGIGRQTALSFAQQGAAVVLAARTMPALRELVDEIHRHWGGRALAVQTDVSDFEQVNHLAGEAIRYFGRIDTWVNNAGVVEYATFEQMTLDEFRRIIDVNLMGIVHGVKAALPVMLRQLTRSTIVNVGSALSERAVPLQAAYVASKHAIKGFTDSIRMELEHAEAPIDVTLILPSSINTPLFDHARSKIGAKPAPMGPVYEPVVVADAIIYSAKHDRVRELFVGGASKVVSVMQKLSPRLVDWYMEGGGGRAFRQQRSDEPADRRDDTLFAANSGDGRGQVRGRFGDRAHASSLYTSLIDPHPMVKTALFALAAAGAAAGLFALGKASRSGRRTVARRLRERDIERSPAPSLKTEIAEDPIFRDLYYPALSALRRQGYSPRAVPAYDRLKARFASALAASVGQRLRRALFGSASSGFQRSYR